MLEIILGVSISVLFLLCLMNAYFIDKTRRELNSTNLELLNLSSELKAFELSYSTRIIELRNLIDASDSNFTYLVNKLKKLEISNILSDIEQLKKDASTKVKNEINK